MSGQLLARGHCYLWIMDHCVLGCLVVSVGKLVALFQGYKPQVLRKTLPIGWGVPWGSICGGQGPADGLNPTFLALHITGDTLYMPTNCCLPWLTWILNSKSRCVAGPICPRGKCMETLRALLHSSDERNWASYIWWLASVSVDINLTWRWIHCSRSPLTHPLCLLGVRIERSKHLMHARRW